MTDGDQGVAAAQLTEEFLSFCPTPDDIVPPAGYRDSGVASIDAVFSMQAHYNGALAVVQRYVAWADLDGAPGLLAAADDPDQHSVQDLQHRLRDIDPAVLADQIFRNRSRQPTTGRLKAELVQEVAAALLDAGVATRHDVAREMDTEAYRRQKAAWTGVRGLGRVTFEYFRLLCGAETSKPDIMVFNWIEGILGHRPSTEDALELLAAVTEELGRRWGQQVSIRGVDHMIWLHQSGRLTHEDDGPGS